MFEYQTACLTDIGGREEQQDRAAAIVGKSAHLLVVADGVGGHAGGALAAQTVIDVAYETFQDFKPTPKDTPAHLLARIVASAHALINVESRVRGLNAHSTCVLLYVDAELSAWLHVGDSRLYRFADGRLVERTKDHSIVESMRLQGRITEEEMKSHPDRNRLYEALGGSQRPQVETGGKPSAANDGFLLVSDGVWEHVAEGDLAAVLVAPDLKGALAELVERAKAQGGPECDNLAVAAVRATRFAPT